MVATILKNVTAKGIEAASQSVSSGLHSNPGTPSIVPQMPSLSDIPDISLLNNSTSASSSNNNISSLEVRPQQASEGLSNEGITEDSYISSITHFLSDTVSNTTTSLGSFASSAGEDASRFVGSYISGSFSHLFPSSLSNTEKSSIEHDTLKIIDEETDMGPKTSISRKSIRRQSDLNWLSHNPYTTVTGRGTVGAKHFRPNHSVDAVRNLLDLVTIQEEETSSSTSPFINTSIDSRVLSHNAGRMIDASDRMASFESIPEDGSHESSIDNTNLASSMSSLPTDEPKNGKISKAETASRLGEGTIRALRDLSLDEALELRHALRYWTERLERPMLYYIESGPKAWMSKEDHRLRVGEKVARVQAVLARRVNSIGDLQQVSNSPFGLSLSLSFEYDLIHAIDISIFGEQDGNGALLNGAYWDREVNGQLSLVVMVEYQTIRLIYQSMIISIYLKKANCLSSPQLFVVLTGRKSQ